MARNKERAAAEHGAETGYLVWPLLHFEAELASDRT